jgi:flagellar hook-length control protein FliK
MQGLKLVETPETVAGEGSPPSPVLRGDRQSSESKDTGKVGGGDSGQRVPAGSQAGKTGAVAPAQEKAAELSDTITTRRYPESPETRPSATVPQGSGMSRTGQMSPAEDREDLSANDASTEGLTGVSPRGSETSNDDETGFSRRLTDGDLRYSQKAADADVPTTTETGRVETYIKAETGAAQRGVTRATDAFPSGSHSAETPRTERVIENTPLAGHQAVMKDDASMEVSLKLDGLGKVDIEVALDQGLINARINTSDTAGKDLIQGNIQTLLDALTKDGLALGNFSVSLKGKRPEAKGEPEQEKERQLPATEEIGPDRTSSGDRIVNIYV